VGAPISNLMAKDRVQVYKQEVASQGGDPLDDVPFPSVIEPQEDAIEAAGYYVQSETARDEDVLIARDASGNMIFKDKANVETTLTELKSGEGGVGLAYAIFTTSGGIVYTTEGHPIIKVQP